MKIVADENIPLVEHYFYGHTLIQKSGRSITRADLVDADILLVRSITKVNKALLHDTAIKFVGSTTAGTDHLDIEWLNQSHISWKAAEGCNANAVTEYVIATVAALKKQNPFQHSMRAGVIGVGHIGQRVTKALTSLGFNVLQCDPWRAEKEADFLHVPLEKLEDLDLITLHTPLTQAGKFPTYHLINKSFLQRQKKESVLLNTSRGAVISFDDLKQYGKHLIWCLDVWEHEPHVDTDILSAAFIATPHIAGYSVQSKYRGIQMMYQALLDHHLLTPTTIPVPHPPTKTIHFPTHSIAWYDAILQLYNPLHTTEEMKKKLLTHSDTFDNLRKNFPERYEFHDVEVTDTTLSAADTCLLKKLGIVGVGEN